MRLRVFTGRTVHEAMQALRRALGDEAVILATAEDEEGVRITAGVELRATRSIRSCARRRRCRWSSGWRSH